MSADNKQLSSSQQSLIQCAIEHWALKFNTEEMFRLKSGRMSPYFFNAGAMDSGRALGIIAEGYAGIIMQAIKEEELSFDVIFGPAYKGISLTAITAVKLSDIGWDCSLAYNRKEAKDHGEGGELVGASLKGKRVLIIDDVITAGTAFRESADIVKKHGGTVAGLVLMLDRQEKGRVGDLDTELSAVQEIRIGYDIPVLSILKFGDLITYVEQSQLKEVFAAMVAYRKQYGVEG